MTAEVVVMNKSAIALAADSKVTIGGSRMSKTYDTVNKLFTMSKCHPVGIMIYGNADFMDYPWETIIKLYRKNIGDKSFKTVEGWSENFLSFLSKFGKIDKRYKEKNLQDVVNSWYAAVFDEIDDLSYARSVDAGEDGYKNIILEVLVDKISDIDEKDDWLSLSQKKSFVKNFGKIVDDVTKEYFDHYEDEELSTIADAFISQAIFSRYPSPLSSGVVIAGFGDDEYFPSVVSLECDGYIGEKIKIYQESSIEVTRQMPGAMRAFAQGEMVQRFMNGVDANFASALMTAFAEVMKENCQSVLEKYGTKRNNTDKSRKEIVSAVDSSVEALIDQVRKYSANAFSNPIVRMISLLPKDEIANLAESLVALTSLKRRVSSDVETVGGAIDVALISKGDGFVWIKRKYYFPEDLNPQFNRNYMTDVKSGGRYEREKSSSVRGGASGTHRIRPNAKAT